MTDAPLPLISVVIPVYNGRGAIEDCLECLLRSRFGPFEVILADDHSTDGALGPLVSPAIRVVSNHAKRGASQARNLGIQEARAGIILLVDADILVADDLLGRVYQFFQTHPEASFLQGVYDPDSYYKNIMSEYKNLIFSFRGHEEGGAYIPFIHSACVAGRSEIFKRYLFDTAFTRREDIEYGLRVSRDGFKIYNDPDLKVRHKKKFSFMTFCRYQFETARQLIIQRFIKQDKNIGSELKRPQTRFYKKVWYLRPVVSAFVLLGLAGSLLSGYTVWKFIFWASLAAILVFDAPFLWYLYRFAPRKALLLAPALYIVDGIAAGSGIVSGLWLAYTAPLISENRK